MFLKEVHDYLGFSLLFFMRLFCGCLSVSDPAYAPANYPHKEYGRKKNQNQQISARRFHPLDAVLWFLVVKALVNPKYVLMIIVYKPELA